MTTRSVLRGSLAVAAALALVACTREGQQGTVSDHREPAPGSSSWFTEVAESAGIDCVQANGSAGEYQLPEIMGSGCAWLDADGDGDLDAYLVSAGTTPETARNRLYRNDGDGVFTDVSRASGTDDRGFGMGCAVGDFDSDGKVDLYVTNFGPNVLLSGRGDGTFADVTDSAGVGDARWSASAAFVDVDGDRHLDLFVTNYMEHPVRSTRPCFDAAGRIEYCGPRTHYRAQRDTLYRNRGDGTFEDITAAAGLADARGFGLGVTPADFDGDGHVDLYVANDATANSLWINDGRGHFVDRAIECGVAFNQHGQPEAGMGIGAADVDGDGSVDLFVTNLTGETNTLYRNDGHGFFEDATHRAGLTGPSLARTGFGAGFLDADSDGDLDIFVANGRVRRGPAVGGSGLPEPWDLYAERDQFFEHIEPSTDTDPAADSTAAGKSARHPAFVERSELAGLSDSAPHLGRGLALGDYDDDGDLDVLVTACGGRARLYRNDAPRRGHWLTVHALERGSAPAHGARVVVEAAGRRWIRRVQPASSYLSSHDPRLHFGLGPAESATITVHWPDGESTRVEAARVDRLYEVRRAAGSGTP